MTLTVTQRGDDAARGSLARGAVELANATAALASSRSLNSPALAIGTTTTKVTLGATLAYTVNGTYASKSSAADVWTLSGTTVAASSWQKYLLLLDASGTASVQEGVPSTIGASSVAWTNVSAVSSAAALLTILNAGKAIAGVLTVQTDASHTFVPGTTALNATGITATYTNTVVDPSLLPVIADKTGRVIGL